MEKADFICSLTGSAMIRLASSDKFESGLRLHLTGTSFHVTNHDHHRIFLNFLWLGKLGMNQCLAGVGFNNECVRQLTGTE